MNERSYAISKVEDLRSAVLNKRRSLTRNIQYGQRNEVGLSRMYVSTIRNVLSCVLFSQSIVPESIVSDDDRNYLAEIERQKVKREEILRQKEIEREKAEREREAQRLVEYQRRNEPLRQEHILRQKNW